MDNTKSYYFTFPNMHETKFNICCLQERVILFQGINEEIIQIICDADSIEHCVMRRDES